MNKTPKLRFKEFSGDWESNNTLSMLKEKKGSIKIGPFGSALKKEFYVESGIKVYAQENVFKNNFEIGNYYVTNEKYETLKSCELIPGDLVISMMGTIGSCAIFPKVSEKGIMNSHLLRLQFKDKYSTKLIAQLLKGSPLIKKQIKKLSVGSIMEGLSSSVVQQLIFTLPDIEEQEKIASFFSLIDDKISLQGEKVEALKDYKTGMMQKIFSRELRFKDEDGRDYPEWEEKKIKDIFTVTRGVVIAKTEISDSKDEENKYPVYSSQTSNNGILGYDSGYDFEGDYLTWTTDGANAGKVFRRNGKFRCTNVCGVLVENKDTIGFANKMISEILNKVTPKHVSYVGNPKLMNGVMGDIKIKVPVIDEQIRIAKVLDSIDLKINKEKEKLDSLNEYKKGLLQQMFV